MVGLLWFAFRATSGSGARAEADSPLDKQIKSSLLADAFNLLGVRRLDPQTLTSARLRARFLCPDKRQSAVVGFV